MPLPHTCVQPPSMACAACMDDYASDEPITVDPRDLDDEQ